MPKTTRTSSRPASPISRKPTQHRQNTHANHEKMPAKATNTLPKNKVNGSEELKKKMLSQIVTLVHDEPIKNLRHVVGKRKRPAPRNPSSKRKLTPLHKIKNTVVRAIKTPVSPSAKAAKTKGSKSHKAVVHTELLKDALVKEVKVVGHVKPSHVQKKRKL